MTAFGLHIGRSRFPLAIHASGRYFVDALGAPFYMMLDAGWSAPNQLTETQMDLYLDDRKARGFTATIIEMCSLLYSSFGDPSYQNAYGAHPFSTINDSGSPYYLATTCDFSSTVDTYWKTVDYFIEGCLRRNILPIAFPAYVGYPATPAQGWYTPLMADTAAHLQAFGAFIASRYGNAPIYGLSGDNDLSQADLDHDWNIVTGMRSVRTDLLIYIKGVRTTGSGYQLAINNGGIARYPGFNVNNAYVSNGSGSYTAASDSLTQYGVSPVMPFFVDETDYEGYPGYTDQDIRYGLICPRLSGSCGDCFGNGQVWAFGGSNNAGLPAIGPAAVLTPTYLATNGSAAATAFSSLMQSYPWWQLVPKTDASLVTTSLGSAASIICPAISSDGALAMIYTAGGAGFTVNLAALSSGSIRARWWDPANGAFTAVSGSPFTNVGTYAFTTPGNNSSGGTDWLLVLD